MTPLLPPTPRRRDRLRARFGSARRHAAVVTSAGLLAAGGTALTVGAPVEVVAPPAVVEVAPDPVIGTEDIAKALVTLPPVAPVADRGGAEGTPIPGGEASYYGRELAGNPTASGEPFDPSGLTAAHRTLPIGTVVRVTHARTGESVVVRINDRGPFHGDRVIDLSRAAADAIGLTRSGTADVELERLPRQGARG